MGSSSSSSSSNSAAVAVAVSLATTRQASVERAWENFGYAMGPDVLDFPEAHMLLSRYPSLGEQRRAPWQPGAGMTALMTTAHRDSPFHLQMSALLSQL